MPQENLVYEYQIMNESEKEKLSAFEKQSLHLKLGILGNLYIHWSSFGALLVAFPIFWIIFVAVFGLNVWVGAGTALFSSAMIILSVVLHELSHVLMGYFSGLPSRDAKTYVFIVYGGAFVGLKLNSRIHSILISIISTPVHALLSSLIGLALINSIYESSWLPAIIVISGFNFIALINNAIPSKMWGNDAGIAFSNLFYVDKDKLSQGRLLKRVWILKPILTLSLVAVGLYVDWLPIVLVGITGSVYFLYFSFFKVIKKGVLFSIFNFKKHLMQ